MYYVYALIDPRNNKPFYIGKGCRNRVFSHEKFKSSCNNPHKDNVIKKILKNYQFIPYKIIQDNFLNEDDAYACEERIISEIGIENLTNICESRRPPNQKGKKRSIDSIEKIRKNSRFQSSNRTINHVKENAEIIYKTLLYINCGVRRNTVITELKITVDLFNKIKKNYNRYIDLINEHTSYSLHKITLMKVNGMRLKIFSDHKDLLARLYYLKRTGFSRKEIVTLLQISPSFYDRVKNIEKEFVEYTNNVK